MGASTVHNFFAEVMSKPDSEINLAEAALFIAALEYPDVDIKKYLKRLDAMGNEMKGRVEKSDDAYDIIEKISAYLFEEMRFHGNTEDYYDPRNSFLNDVLDRRMGIPITLSVIYMEIAERIDFPLEGVGFPGHFLIRYKDGNEEILIDPFNKGITLSMDDCQQRLDDIYGGTVPLRPEFLQRVSKKQILTRMLSNLKGIYLHRKDYRKALDTVEMILCINPSAAQEVRDRGLIHYNLKDFSKALIDLKRYLRLEPSAEDAQEIQNHIKLMQQYMAMMN
jgi:regulator of sirC expression with transglutaminase-like and TPR domain